MKLKIQIVKDSEEYYRKIQLNMEDPLVHPKPDLELDSADYNIADDLIDGYRIIEPDQSETMTKQIFIFTILGEYVVEYNEKVAEELDKILDIRNKVFRKDLIK